jgi:hypothetical protein
MLTGCIHVKVNCGQKQFYHFSRHIVYLRFSEFFHLMLDFREFQKYL